MASSLTSNAAKLLLVASLVACSAAPHRPIWSHPDGSCAIDHPAVRILSLTGATCDDGIFVVPYQVNLLAMEALAEPSTHPFVRAYIRWYLDNLNASDRHGLSGTIYDLVVYGNGDEDWSGNYDSADAYAATFLSLVTRYVEATKDRELALEINPTLEDIAYVILTLQASEDGLTWVWPKHDSKYLMDNCETYAGLMDYDHLRREFMGKTDSEYKDVALAIRDGIKENLFDLERLNFYFGIDRDLTPYRSNWHTRYPDALAQLFPIVYGVVEARSPLARHLWQEFSLRHGVQNMESEEQRMIVRKAHALVMGKRTISKGAKQ